MVSPAGSEPSPKGQFQFDGSDPFPTDWSPEQWQQSLSDGYISMRDRAPSLHGKMQSEIPHVWRHFEEVLNNLGTTTKFEDAPLAPEQFLGEAWHTLLQIRSFVIKLRMTRDHGDDPKWRMIDPKSYGFSSPGEMWEVVQPFAEKLELFINYVEDRPFSTGGGGLGSFDPTLN